MDTLDSSWDDDGIIIEYLLTYALEYIGAVLQSGRDLFVPRNETHHLSISGIGVAKKGKQKCFVHSINARRMSTFKDKEDLVIQKGSIGP